jgi:hypothetical protein
VVSLVAHLPHGGLHYCATRPQGSILIIKCAERRGEEDTAPNGVVAPAIGPAHVECAPMARIGALASIVMRSEVRQWRRRSHRWLVIQQQQQQQHRPALPLYPRLRRSRRQSASRQKRSATRPVLEPLATGVALVSNRCKAAQMLNVRPRMSGCSDCTTRRPDPSKLCSAFLLGYIDPPCDPPCACHAHRPSHVS